MKEIKIGSSQGALAQGHDHDHPRADSGECGACRARHLEKSRVFPQLGENTPSMSE